MLTQAFLLWLSAFCLCPLCSFSKHTYIDTGNTGVAIDTLMDRMKASDVTHGAPARFLESDIVKAQEEKHLWSRDLEWHIENYSNYYDPNEVGSCPA